MPSNFHLKNRRYVLFTYAQSGPDFDYWAVVDLLGELGAECIIGRELHEDGGIHYHVFADFGRLFSTRKVRIFDVGGKHPNIQPIGRTPAKAYDYAIKDGDVVAGGLGRPGGDCDWDPDNFWSAATHAGSADEFLHFCDQLAPRDLVRSFPNFRAYANWKWNDRVAVYDQPDGAIIDTSAAPGIDEWLSQSAIGSGKSRARYVLRGARADTSILGSLNDEVPRASRTPAAHACLRGGPLATPSSTASRAGAPPTVA